MKTSWIKLEEKWPSEGQGVIYFFKWAGVHRGVFHNFSIGPLPPIPSFSSEIGWLGSDVTHWMPDREGDLPDPPPANEIEWED